MKSSIPMRCAAFVKKSIGVEDPLTLGLVVEGHFKHFNRQADISSVLAK